MAARRGAGGFPQNPVIPGSFPRHYTTIRKARIFDTTPRKLARIFDTTPRHSSNKTSSTYQVGTSLLACEFSKPKHSRIAFAVGQVNGSAVLRSAPALRVTSRPLRLKRALRAGRCLPARPDGPGCPRTAVLDPWGGMGVPAALGWSDSQRNSSTGRARATKVLGLAC